MVKRPCRWWWALLVLVALTGCERDAAPAAAPPDTSAPATPEFVEPAWRTPLNVLSAPEVSDGLAVVVASAGRDDLEVVALDTASGTVQWRRPVSTSVIPGGYGPQVFVGARYVVVPAPVAGPSAEVRLEVVAATSGEVTWTSRPLLLLEPLSVCTDGTDVCAGMVVGGDSAQHRLDLTALALRAEPEPGPIGSGELVSLGDGLFVLREAESETLLRRRGSTVVWRKPLEMVFGTGHDTGFGWEFDFAPQDGTYVGHVGLPFDPAQVRAFEAGRRVALNLAERYDLVSLSARSGSILWADRGLTTLCLPEEISPAAAHVRCRVAGRAVNRKGDPVRFRDLSLALEGFDPDTGEVLWSRSFAVKAAARIMGRRATVLTNDRIVVVEEAGVGLVSPVDGTAEPVPADSVWWCAGERASYADDRSGARLAFPCHPDGTQAPLTELTKRAVTEGAIPAGEGRYVIATPGALVGYAW